MPGPVSAKLISQSRPRSASDTVSVPPFRHFHGADSVFAEVPEHLFEFVAIGQHPSFGLGEPALELDAGIFSCETVLQQSESVIEQRDQIYTLEAILLAARVSQEIGNDIIEPIGLAVHDLQQVALFGIQGWRIR